MARAFSYANRDDFKSWMQSSLSTSVTIHDTTIDPILRAVSKQIDKFCQRELHPYTATKYFTAERAAYLRLDADLLSITTLKTSESEDTGSRTYEDTWATTDYDLEPYDAADMERPYNLIRARDTGSYAFPSGVRKGVEIAGTWGYWSSRTSSGTLAEALDATETGIDMTAGHGLKPLQTILVGTEQMFITSISTNTLTVLRGVNGTTAAIADTGAAVTVYEYPFDVVQATYLMAGRLFKRKDAPLGIAGNAETGISAIAKFDPDVRALLKDYRRLFAIGVA